MFTLLGQHFDHIAISTKGFLSSFEQHLGALGGLLGEPGRIENISTCGKIRPVGWGYSQQAANLVVKLTSQQQSYL